MRALLGIAGLVLVVGCQFERPRDVPADAAPDAVSAGVRIASISAPWVRIDGEVSVSVALEREPGMVADIVVTLAEGGRNLTAEPLVLSGSASSGALVVHASTTEGVVPGLISDVGLTASTPTGSVAGSFDVLVAGLPGHVDESFGVVGVAAFAPGEPGGAFRQGDGVVVASGDKIARFGRDGALDPSFGDGGVAAPGFDRLVSAARVFPAELSSGRIIAVGNGHGDNPKRYDVFLQRLTSGGAKDVTYAQRYQPLSDSFEVAAVAVAGDDSLVVGGRLWGVSGNDVVIRKFDDRGAVDASFGLSGKVVISYGDLDLLQGLAVSSDGAVLVAVTGGDQVVRLSRWTPSGQPDGGFAGGGEVVLNELLPESPDFVEVRSLRIDDAGRIWACGWYSSLASANLEAFVVRFTPQGTLDGTFGVGGVWSLVRAAHDLAVSVVEIGDEGLLVGGATAAELIGAESGMVAHLTGGGSLISDLGPTGAAELDFPFIPSPVAFVDPESRGWYLGGTSAAQPAVVRLWY